MVFETEPVEFTRMLLVDMLRDASPVETLVDTIHIGYGGEGGFGAAVAFTVALVFMVVEFVELDTV